MFSLGKIIICQLNATCYSIIIDSAKAVASSTGIIVAVFISCSVLVITMLLVSIPVTLILPSF